MTHDIDDLNPYRAPLAPIGPNRPEAVEGGGVRRRFRWRVIGVTVLYLYGGSLVLIALLSTIHMAVWFAIFVRRGEMVRLPWVATVVVGAIVALMLGLACIVAGRSLWKARWMWAAAAMAGAAALYSAYAAAGGRLIGI